MGTKAGVDMKSSGGYSSCSSYISQYGSNGYQGLRLLLQKVLTSSDVGSNGRIILPKAVELWLVEKAVLPIENSVGGSIHRNYDLLIRHRLHIVGEVKLVINHCLIGLPGVRKEELKTVLSHPQALDQCKMILDKLGVVRESANDTGSAAKIVASVGVRDEGAVAVPNIFAGEFVTQNRLETEDFQSLYENQRQELALKKSQGTLMPKIN